ncbi:anti-sigma factor family protein [Enemella sp. A6]|uniref:anti-sigma factor family protein n=1 Tax=Enemella sp. A6 TaxID=3440152 RepID=UPI003EB92471
MSRHCEPEATLSAFVDDALSGAERDRVAAHLAECPDCRAEVAALRRVQHLLGATRDPAGGHPAPLAERLVSIAGARADQPLWTQPFDRPLDDRAPLPSRRRARRRNLTGAIALLTGVMVGLVGIGWAAAPAPDIEIVNPAAKARAEFAHVAAQRSFVMDSTVAAWAIPAHERLSISNAAKLTPLPVRPGRRLSGEESRTVLSAAEQSTRVVDHSGTQRVRMTAGEHRVVAVNVAVRHRSTQGTQVEVLDEGGKPERSAFLQVRESGRQAWPDELSGKLGQHVLGRPAVLIEARRDGLLVARWWFDQKTAVQLAQESYDTDGSLRVQAVTTGLSIDRQQFVAHPPPRLVRPSAAAYLNLSQVGEVRDRGWSCHQQLAGLPLARLGNDPGTAVHTTYSDGASAITVRQERGTILEAPEGFAWDDSVGAYRRDGSPTIFIWQSQDSVFTVVTDGPSEVATKAVAELPHDAPVLRTRWGRVQAGWRHLSEMVAGR